MRRCQNRDIFSVYIPTRARSVHKNDQHVQGWQPTTNFFFENRKNSKQKLEIEIIDINRSLCMLMIIFL